MAGKGEILVAGGINLGETLRLNFIGADGQFVISGSDDLPPWERSHPGPLEEFDQQRSRADSFRSIPGSPGESVLSSTTATSWASC